MSKKSACILCSRNCGITVEVDDNGHLKKIKGDPDHPVSQGYVCQKAVRLDHYQNNSDRVYSPLKRKSDGTFEEISWDQAISEIGEKLKDLRQKHGGKCIAGYTSGQGNHLGGANFSSLRRALGTRFSYNALAQEKTGDAWVNGYLFGSHANHISEDIENSDFVVFIGTNPWQAHGIRNARTTLLKLSKDPLKKIVVIDPRFTETAKLADCHIQLKPGTDAALLSAVIACILQNGWEDKRFIDTHCLGFDEVRKTFLEIDVVKHCQIAGIDRDVVESFAYDLSHAKSGVIRVDLGIQQSINSTLNSYFEKLLFLLTGNFSKKGGNNLHTWFAALLDHSKRDFDETCTDLKKSWKTSVHKVEEIGGIFPPNVLPKEINSDSEGRIRALIMRAGNLMVSGADTKAYQQAFEKLELLVVLDVAMTESARLADYVLPCPSQFEKWEATFFNLEFPTNFFHLRPPLLKPKGNTLNETEVFYRIWEKVFGQPKGLKALEVAAKMDRKLPGKNIYGVALLAYFKLYPHLKSVAPMILHRTLGRALPGKEEVAILWYLSMSYYKQHTKACERVGVTSGEDLFQKILNSPEGLIISRHEYEENWQLLEHPDRKVHLAIPKLLRWVKEIEVTSRQQQYPFVLTAGERRSYNANTIYRDPAWRKGDKEGRLKIHPKSAERLGLQTGDWARCRSARGEVTVCIEATDTVQENAVTLPHGYGLDLYEYGGKRYTGPYLNKLTDLDDCDPIAKTPHYKYVCVAIEPLNE